MGSLCVVYYIRVCVLYCAGNTLEWLESKSVDHKHLHRRESSGLAAKDIAAACFSVTAFTLWTEVHARVEDTCTLHAWYDSYVSHDQVGLEPRRVGWKCCLSWSFVLSLGT